VLKIPFLSGICVRERRWVGLWLVEDGGEGARLGLREEVGGFFRVIECVVVSFMVALLLLCLCFSRRTGGTCHHLSWLDLFSILVFICLSS